MKTVNKLDYIYRKLVVKAQEQHNETVEISNEDYAKYYEDNTDIPSDQNYQIETYLRFDNSNYLDQTLMPAMDSSFSNVFCRIWEPTNNKLSFQNNQGITSTINLTRQDAQSTKIIGHNNSSGVIVGYGLNGTFYCYDALCPNCYDNNLKHVLSMNSSGMAICPECNKQYDLTNNGLSQQDDRLVRYKASTTGPGGLLIINGYDNSQEEDSIININQNPIIDNIDTKNLSLPRLHSMSHNIFIQYKTKNENINIFNEYDLQMHITNLVAYSFENRIYGNQNIFNRETDEYTWENDPNITQETYTKEIYDNIYQNSEFDRGHIGKSIWHNAISEKETNDYYYSLCMPMYHNFNAGLWNDIENFIDNFIKRYQNSYVVMGGTISHGNILRYISNGNDSLPVPKYYYAAILVKTDSNTYKALGFFVEHTNEIIENIDLRNYIVSIDELEQLTVIDFFCNLPDNIENQIESLTKEQLINMFFNN